MALMLQMRLLSTLQPLHKNAFDGKFGNEKSSTHKVLSFSFACDSVGIRTPNLRIRSAMLYPVELQGPFRHDRRSIGGQR